MPPATLGELISNLYTYALSIVGLCVFIMFLYAGVSLMVGYIDKGKAIKIFQDAVIGTVLLYSAYIILNSINHDLVSQRSGTGPSNPNSSGFSAGGTANTGNSGIGTSSDIKTPTPTPFQPGGGGFGGSGASSTF